MKKKFADGGPTQPDDAVNPEALKGMTPPESKPAPKRKMTMDEIGAQMRKAGKSMPKKMAKGGRVGRGDGIAQRGKTKGRII
jgi:hypothetical protein